MKVISVYEDLIEFEDGTTLSSDHDPECCERHYLCFDDLRLEDFEGLEFDLSGDDFFERVPEYGIKLIPKKGWPINVPGYAYNNGYYSHELRLVVTSPTPGWGREYDITECQEWN